jgi:hypothetical protein
MTRTPWVRALGLGGALALLVALFVTAFAWPTAHAGPHDVSVGLVAPAPVAGKVEQALASAAPGAFEVTTYPDADAARAEVTDRDVDGALVLGAGRPQLYVASAGSSAVAQLLEQVATTAATELTGTPAATPVVATTDLVPLPAADSRGTVLAAGVVPTVIGSIAIGAIASLVVRGRARRLALVAVASVGGGLLVAAVLAPWLGALPDAYWAVAGVVALGLAGSALLVAGMRGVAGPAGIGIGAVVVMLVGNPSSGAASAPDLLPTAWGVVGPLLPPGAMVEALRAVTFFDGAHAGRALTVLVAWVALGVALLRAGRRGSWAAHVAQAAHRAQLAHRHEHEAAAPAAVPAD